MPKGRKCTGDLRISPSSLMVTVKQQSDCTLTILLSYSRTIVASLVQREVAARSADGEIAQTNAFLRRLCLP